MGLPETSEVLRLDQLRVWFPVKRGFSARNAGPPLLLKAVDGVSLGMRHGEVLGIVGESGCGKSTLARTIVRLESPTSGAVYIDGEDMSLMKSATLRRLRPRLQMIFQDPYASLNPRMTVFDAIAEPLHVHKKLKGAALAEEVYDLMDQVGLARRYVRKYPHEFSGGQRQRIAIARALSLKPMLLLADEPVSALDVSVQAQIINLLETLQRETGLALMFISHDLMVVRHIARRIAVMYLGRIVETGPAEALFARPCHPYTKMLLASVPLPEPEKERLRVRPVVQGEPPSPLHPPTGCPFHPRCPVARPECATEEPALESADGAREVACPYTE
jgi:oligopeptide transport system ATP-binding protein